MANIQSLRGMSVDQAADLLTERFLGGTKRAEVDPAVLSALLGAGLGAGVGGLTSYFSENGDPVSGALGGATLGGIGGLGLYGGYSGLFNTFAGPGAHPGEVNTNRLKEISEQHPLGYAYSSLKNIDNLGSQEITANISGNPAFYTAAPLGYVLGHTSGNMVDRYRAVAAANSKNPYLANIARSSVPFVGGLKTLALKPRQMMYGRDVTLNPKAVIPDPSHVVPMVQDMTRPQAPPAAAGATAAPIYPHIPDPSVTPRTIPNPFFDPVRDGPKYTPTQRAQNVNAALEEFRGYLHGEHANKVRRTPKFTRGLLGAGAAVGAVEAYNRLFPYSAPPISTPPTGGST